MQPRPDLEGTLAGHLRILDHESIELVSSDEMTEDGVRVFKLMMTENVSSSNESTTTLQATIFVDSKSYLFVDEISDQMHEFTMHSRTNGAETEIPSWSHSAYTSHFYEYNQPVSIQIPDEYTPPFEFNSPTARP